MFCVRSSTAYLRGMAYLVNHYVPQQAVHREKVSRQLLHAPFWLPICQRCPVGLGALLHRPPVILYVFQAPDAVGILAA